MKSLALVGIFVSSPIWINTAFATVVLPDAVSYEYFGLNFANNIQTNSSVGTLNISTTRALTRST